MSQTIGLTTAQAEERLKKDGENTLKSKNAINPAAIFAGQFKDLFVIILLICTGVSVYMGEIAEALAITCIVFVNAVIGFFQEYKTEKTLEALKNMAAPTTKVYRDGRVCVIPAALLVRGDLIITEAGDKVPADALLIESTSMEADESILTGESIACEKKAAPNRPLSDRPGESHVIYMGTAITKGHGKATVISTGMSTQMGRIAGMLDEIEDEHTPLQKRLNELSKVIAVICLTVCAVITGAGILRGQNVIDMLITGVSLAVAAVPEGLPAVVTIALALAVGRMVKRKALIKKLHAVETLGCASVICSDKTGTLTENKMTVKKIVTYNDVIDVEGNRFAADGTGVNINSHPAARLLVDVAAVCNNALLDNDGGDPTETALLVMAAKAGITKDNLEYTRAGEIPFDSDRKCMSVIVKANNRRYIFTKGAYDVVIKKCGYAADKNSVQPLTVSVKDRIRRANEGMAEDALRVLGFAYRDITGISSGELESSMIFLGLAGMIDPPRKEALEAVRLCRSAGIKTVMITGDHKTTACAIARQLKIYRTNDLCMTGEEIDSMDEFDFARRVNSVSVFARVSPSHKLKIVRALKRHGHIVAMTGDGVNDAPAVKEADIGVAMGISGTDVTKEAADVMLLDDNFATLVSAVEEGRVIYSNIRKFIRYLLSCNIGEVITMFAGMLMLGIPQILLPMQILLINLVTDGLPAIALGMEPAEKSIMKKKPRSKKEGVLAGRLMFMIIFRGVLIGLSTLAVFTVLYKMYYNIHISRTGAFLALIFMQLIHVFECKSEEKTIFSIPFFNNIKLILAVGISGFIAIACVYVESIGRILRTVPLNLNQLAIVIVISLAVPVINAIATRFRSRVSHKFAYEPQDKHMQGIEDVK
ncbi:MAG: cation-translocating P-type ATPase [Oscillospiraceae bacterium]|nr:cation-translocating P-type ATPase [Oscillospiraceae bacterium]